MTGFRIGIIRKKEKVERYDKTLKRIFFSKNVDFYFLNL